MELSINNPEHWQLIQEIEEFYKNKENNKNK